MVATDPVTDLTLQIGELRITISSPDRRGLSHQSVHTEVPVSLAGPRAQEASPSSASSWSLIGAAPAVWSTEWVRTLICAKGPEDYEAIDLTPVSHLACRLRSQARSGWTPLRRLGRALRAGLSARDCLRNPYPTAVVRSPSLDLKNLVFVVLRGGPRGRAGWTKSPEIYFRAVGGAGEPFDINSVSHAFPSEVEAEAYCNGAGVRWPPGPQLDL